MFNKVLIAADAGLAFTHNSDGWKKASYNGGNVWSDCDPQEVHNMYRMATDISSWEANSGETSEEIYLSLQRKVSENRSFFYLLAGIDPSLSEELRTRALKLAEKYLKSDASLFEYAQERLISAIPPENALWKEGFELSKRHSFGMVASLLFLVIQHERNIHHIASCWEALAVLPSGTESRQLLWKQLVRQGYFSKVLSLTRACASKTELAVELKSLGASLFFPQEFPFGFDFGKSFTAYHHILVGEFEERKDSLLDQPKKFQILERRLNSSSEFTFVYRHQNVDPDEQKIAPIPYTNRFNFKSAIRLEKAPLSRLAKYRLDKANTIGRLCDMHLVKSSSESFQKATAKRRYRLFNSNHPD